MNEHSPGGAHASAELDQPSSSVASSLQAWDPTEDVGQNGDLRELQAPIPFLVVVGGKIYEGLHLTRTGMCVAGLSARPTGDVVRGSIRFQGERDASDVAFEGRILSARGADTFLAVAKLNEEDVSHLDYSVGTWLRRDGSGGGGDGMPPRLALAGRPRLARILGTMGMAAFLIVAGLAMLVGKLTTVRPLHAAVAGDTLPIRAPGSGVVVWVNSAQTVAPGQPVVTLSTFRSREAAMQLDQAVALGEQNLKSKTSAAQDVRKTFGTYRQASSISVEMGRASEQSIAEQVRLQNGRVDRLAELAAGGFISRDRLDAEKIKLAALKTQYVEAKRAMQESQLARASAAQGYYLDQGRATQRSVLDTSREESAAADELQRLRLLRSAALPVERIEAPCRCTIGNRRVQRGVYVSEGELLLSLHKQMPGAGRRPSRVEAVVPLEQISKIDVGSRATVWLPGKKNAFRGTVSRITYDLTTASDGGLPKQVLEQGGVALVVVSLADAADIPSLEYGTPVRLNLHASLATALGF